MRQDWDQLSVEELSEGIATIKGHRPINALSVRPALPLKRFSPRRTGGF